MLYSRLLFALPVGLSSTRRTGNRVRRVMPFEGCVASPLANVL